MTKISQPILRLSISLGLLALSGCAALRDQPGALTAAPFGTTADGRAVQLYTLRNGQGCEVKITNYGGTVVSLSVPDRQGMLGDVVLGFDRLVDYLQDSPYFGCLIGRYANRIARGTFSIDGTTYSLATNNPPNHLHGGIKGFDKVVWSARAFWSRRGPALELRHVSRDGEEGYPGRLDVKAVYTLTEDNELQLDLEARADRDTICNLTGHSYFNLAGPGDILGHILMIDAKQFTPIDQTLIPTGQLPPVDGTPFDFRQPTPIGARIDQDHPQLKSGNGYDHNWVLDKPADVLALAATVYEPRSGRVLEVWTTAPGIQFYSGNFLDGHHVGKGGQAYAFRSGLCLEPQFFPDSPNQPAFPSPVLKAGDTYRHSIIYRFSAR
ncbi:galactose mutarotase [bacterium]|nr:galactose mutarotase [bacterium]